MIINIKMAIATVIIASATFSNIYEKTVPKIEGGTQSLNSYHGKKILVVTLPLIHNLSADSLLYSLDTLAQAHAGHLNVIAVPAYEDGYTAASKDSLRTWYRSKLNNNILITEGLYCRKTSLSLQHPLFKWLTKVDENTQFEIDVEAAGQKYFVSATGMLYGVLRAETKMWSSAVNTTLVLDVE